MFTAPTRCGESGRPLKRRAFMGVIIPSARPPAFPAGRVQIKWSSDTTRPGGGPSANGEERVTPRPARARQRRFTRKVSGRLLLMGFSPSVGRTAPLKISSPALRGVFSVPRSESRTAFPSYFSLRFCFARISEYRAATGLR